MSGYNSKKRKASTRNPNGRTSGGGSSRYGATENGFHYGKIGTASGTSSRSGNPISDPSGRDVSGLGFSSIPATNQAGESVPNWLAWLQTFQGSNDYNFDSLLSAIGSHASNPLISLLSAFAFNQSGDIKESQASDWNKQLLDQILSYTNTLDDRNYKKGVLDEQRLYDNPQNQLARLMGAGISRDAALQLLGQGNEPFAADAAAVPAGVAPSESQSNFANSASALAGIAFGAIDGLAGLVNMGLSFAQAKQQIDYMKNQNFLLRSQVDSYVSAGDAFSILNSADSPKESFGSVASAAKALTALADSGNQDAANFIQSGGLDKMKRNAGFASRTLSGLYRSERSSADYAREYTGTMRKLEADARYAEVNIDLLNQEIVNAKADYERICAETGYLDALTEVQAALKLNYEADTKLKGSQSEYYDAAAANQTAQAELTNFDVLRNGALFGASIDGKGYLDWYVDGTMNDLARDAKIALKTNNKEYIEACYTEMLNTKEAVGATMALKKLQMEAGAEFFTKYPQEAKLYKGLEESGVYHYIAAKVSAHQAGYVQSNSFGTNMPLDLPELTPDKEKSFWKKIFGD